MVGLIPILLRAIAVVSPAMPPPIIVALSVITGLSKMACNVCGKFSCMGKATR